MKIRNARLADVPAVIAMNKQGWYEDFAGRGYIPNEVAVNEFAKFSDPALIRRTIEDYDAYVVVEDDNGEVIGAANAGILNENEAELWWIHVMRPGRRRGLGSQLIDAVIERLPERINTLYVTTILGYDPTIAFYKSVGFVEHSVIPADEAYHRGADSLHLRMDLHERHAKTAATSGV